MKNLLLIIAILLGVFAKAQQENLPVKEIKTHNNGAITGIIIWNNPVKTIENNISLKGESPLSFNSFAIGFSVSEENFDYKILIINYRTRKSNELWSEWKSTEIDYLPSQTPTNMYWTDLQFNPTEELYQEFDFIIENAPEGLSQIRANFISEIANPAHQNISVPKPGGCPPFPGVITREVWLHPYYGSQSYTPTTIYPTHVVVHHGADPDTYTDGAAVVRSYWNYHVNTLGWSDIGYNYLGDKYGNLYQGRKNDDMEGRDVRGAHAGTSNDYSIGINFLGNADVTTPTTVQLEAYYALLGWWFDSRGFDPTSSASLVLQSGGTAVKPRILGHKDTNIGGTSCPGTVLYALLPTIRTSVKAVIDACMANPTTSIAGVSGYQTSNFNANFTDTDQELSLYQVLDNNGIEWRANGNFGFLNDNFQTALHSEWSSVLGTWNINSGHLNQTDEVESNTNLYIPVNQVSGNVYMYHFQMNIGGSGTNRRAGLHFFCDNGTMTQRNNSYMVYFRADGNKCQIYKAVDDNITLYTDDNCTVTPNVWYDYKIIFNTLTGEIKAFQNNVLVSSWTDTDPFSAGDFLSLRTGNCNVLYDDLKVYKSRNASQTVTIGSSANEVRYQNSNPDIASCRIKSIVVSAYNQISSIAGTDVHIDWSPASPPTVNDGLVSDIDTFYSNTELSASWSASTDLNSGIAAYYYCIGDYPGAANIVAWTNNGLLNSFTKTGLSLSYETTYYVSVKVLNNAGLESTPVSSNGQFLKSPLAQPVCGFQASANEICEGQSITLINTSIEANSYSWIIEGGIPGTSNLTNPEVFFSNPGTYEITLFASGPGGIDTLVQNITISLYPAPTSNFYALDTILAIPGAFATFVNQSVNAESYLWTFGDGGISSDVNPWHLYENEGYYSVRLITENSYCNADTLLLNNYIQVINPTNIETSENKIINFYPNPFSSNLIIETEKLSPVSLEIINIKGDVIRTIEFSNSKSKIDLATDYLNTGIYFFKLNTEKGEFIFKAQKQK
ncbi:MAG: N-acetylmuramoyl-L-alanine amidase [Bacteroidales bacterium]|nr:N-acetylmuramoyl-L-alanine amidase [Bacteroidales bacterium]